MGNPLILLAAHPRPSKKGLSMSRSKPRAMPGVSMSDATLNGLLTTIREVPDFPKPGILFQDVTPLLGDPRAFHTVIDAFVHEFIGQGVTAIVGIESRGFIFGAALAARLNVSFVPVRKPGKLPAKTRSVKYALEYGEAELHMHEDALRPDARVVIIDDLLATGGTADAAAQLVEQAGGVVVAFGFVVGLEALGGWQRLASAFRDRNPAPECEAPAVRVLVRIL